VFRLNKDIFKTDEGEGMFDIDINIWKWIKSRVGSLSYPAHFRKVIPESSAFQAETPEEVLDLSNSVY